VGPSNWKEQPLRLGSTALLRAEMTLDFRRLSDFSSTKEKDPLPLKATYLTKYLLQPYPTPKLCILALFAPFLANSMTFSGYDTAPSVSKNILLLTGLSFFSGSSITASSSFYPLIL
jgi:hypothetical protein